MVVSLAMTTSGELIDEGDWREEGNGRLIMCGEK